MFPDVVTRYTVHAAEVAQLPVIAGQLAALLILAAALGPHMDVRVKKGWQRQCALWGLLLMERKSATTCATSTEPHLEWSRPRSLETP
jgi:hypothetical protein